MDKARRIFIVSVLFFIVFSAGCSEEKASGPQGGGQKLSNQQARMLVSENQSLQDKITNMEKQLRDCRQSIDEWKKKYEAERDKSAEQGKKILDMMMQVTQENERLKAEVEQLKAKLSE